MSLYPFRVGRYDGGAFGAVFTLAIIVLACVLPLAAFGANPLDEMTKQGIAVGGGVDPQGDSWLSMRNSLEQFLHPEFMLRLFLSLTLAVACAWVLAWDPRRPHAWNRRQISKNARHSFSLGWLAQSSLN
jgi:hypothetical protein